MDLDSKKLWFGFSTAVILLMIYLADVEKFLSAVSSANKLQLVPAYLLGLSSFLVLSFVWYRFLKKVDSSINYFKTFKMFMAGHFMNAVTPLGQFGGEPFMAYIISKNTDTSYEEAFSTVFSADLVNSIPGFTFLIGGAVYLVFFGSVTDRILQIVGLGLVSAIVLALLLYLLWFKSGTVEKKILGLIERITQITGRGKKFLKAAEERLEEVEKSFETIGRDPKTLFSSIAFTHLTFIINTLIMFSLLTAVGVQSPNFTSIYFVLILSELANFTPTPGGSGTFEAAMATMITLFIGASFATGLVVAILFRTTNYWPGILIGYLSLNTLKNDGGPR